MAWFIAYGATLHGETGDADNFIVSFGNLPVTEAVDAEVEAGNESPPQGEVPDTEPLRYPHQSQEPQEIFGANASCRSQSSDEVSVRKAMKGKDATRGHEVVWTQRHASQQRDCRKETSHPE